MFRHASQAALKGRKWFPEMWRHVRVDEEEKDEEEEEDDDEDAVAAGGAEDPPQTEPQAEPHDTTPPNNPSSGSWFDLQFDIHLGRDADRY